jgi:dolichyl-phosphate-mannose-protein mannosyltransferase
MRCAKIITSAAFQPECLVSANPICVHAMDSKILFDHTGSLEHQRLAINPVKFEPKSSSAVRAAHVCLISVIIFVVAHFALLIGISTPEKFVFDEVHYVPAARQMLEHAPTEPILNPMHPPLAKQIMALSIRAFGDDSFAWRYPGSVFGALSVVAIYLCALAVFASHGPAIAAALIAFFNQMLFVMARTAMLDIYALGFGLLATAAFLHGFSRQHPHRLFALAGLGFGLAAACKWSGLFPLGVCVIIVAVIRLMQSWRTQFADARASDWYSPELWPDFRYYHFAACFVLAPAVTYLASFVALDGFSISAIIEAQRRIFADNTTTAIAGHTYMSSWLSWPFLVRPVWFLFDKVGDDRIAAVVFLGNPLVLWPALLALAIALRDFIVTRRRDTFLVLSFYLGPYLAWALLPRTLGFIYYYLPAATFASLALVYALRRGNAPRFLLWAYVAVAATGFAVMLPISAAFVGTSMRTFNRLMIFQNWI